MITKRKRIYVFDVVNTLLMLLVCIITLYPIMFILGRSFMGSVEKAHHPLRIFPRAIALDAYSYIFRRGSFITTGLFNSVKLTVVGTVMNMLVTAPMAYVLSKKNYPLHNPITGLVIFTLWFGGGLIPNYLLVISLGLRDTYWALWLPELVSAWNMIVLRNFFSMISPELEESARIDGANDLIIFTRLILPLSAASLASISLFYAVGHWNSWFNAMIYVNDVAKLPLQNQLRRVLVSITALSTKNTASFSEGTSSRVPTADILQFACVIVTITPIMAVYPFLQRYFVKGVLAGSLKG